MSDRLRKTSTATKASGTEPSNSRLQKLKAQKKKGSTTFGDCEPEKLQELIWRAVDYGALVSFSKTSDGGALVVYVKDGLDEFKEYAASEDALAELLALLIETYAAP